MTDPLPGNRLQVHDGIGCSNFFPAQFLEQPRPFSLRPFISKTLEKGLNIAFSSRKAGIYIHCIKFNYLLHIQEIKQLDPPNIIAVASGRKLEIWDVVKNIKIKATTWKTRTGFADFDTHKDYLLYSYHTQKNSSSFKYEVLHLSTGRLVWEIYSLSCIEHSIDRKKDMAYLLDHQVLTCLKLGETKPAILWKKYFAAPYPLRFKLSPKGTYTITRNDRSACTLTKTTTGFVYHAATNFMHHIAFSFDEQWIAHWRYTHVTFAEPLRSQSEFSYDTGHQITKVQFNPDNRLVAAYAYGEIRLMTVCGQLSNPIYRPNPLSFRGMYFASHRHLFIDCGENGLFTLELTDFNRLSWIPLKRIMDAKSECDSRA